MRKNVTIFRVQTKVIKNSVHQTDGSDNQQRIVNVENADRVCLCEKENEWLRFVVMNH